MNHAILGEILAKESRFPQSEIFFANLKGAFKYTLVGDWASDYFTMYSGNKVTINTFSWQNFLCTFHAYFGDFENNSDRLAKNGRKPNLGTSLLVDKIIFTRF